MEATSLRSGSPAWHEEPPRSSYNELVPVNKDDRRIEQDGKITALATRASTEPKASTHLHSQETVEASFRSLDRILAQNGPDELTEAMLAHTLRQGADFGAPEVQGSICRYFDMVAQDAKNSEDFTSFITQVSARADAAGGMPDGRWIDIARAALGEESDLAVEWGADAVQGTIERNLALTLYLEKAAPGSVHYLRDEYGIQHFGRYPAELLLEMFQKRDDTGPWGLTIYSKADHNDAFYHSEPLRQMHAEVGDAFTTRIIECGSVAEVRRLMARLVARHGKAGFVIINAHGTAEGMRLGEGQDQVLTKDVVNERFGFLLHECTEEGAGICLDSCSTGRQGAISEHVAAASGKETVAPTADTAVKDYGAEPQGRVIRFHPQYYEGAARTVAGNKRPGK